MLSLKKGSLICHPATDTMAEVLGFPFIFIPLSLASFFRLYFFPSRCAHFPYSKSIYFNPLRKVLLCLHFHQKEFTFIKEFERNVLFKKDFCYGGKI